MTRPAKALFGQVGDQVSQVKDQVGQGLGQELDNFSRNNFISSFSLPIISVISSSNLKIRDRFS